MAAWLQDWNEENPESPIRVTNRVLAKQVKQVATPSADRMLAGAPKGMRSRLAGEPAAPERRITSVLRVLLSPAQA